MKQPIEYVREMFNSVEPFEKHISTIIQEARKEALSEAAELVRPTNDNLKLWPDSLLLTKKPL